MGAIEDKSKCFGYCLQTKILFFFITYQQSVMLPEFVVFLHIGICFTGHRCK